MTVKELFAVAIDADSKEQRRNAFRELRRLSLYGEQEEAQQARFALEHSGEYAAMHAEVNECRA